MSEPTPSSFPDHVVESGPARLSSDNVEQILGDFREWLQELSQASEDGSPIPESEASIPDLSTLLGEMIALKQEVHLQTRGVRTQQEQNQDTLQQLMTALDLLQQGASHSQEEDLKRILKTFVELYDVLSLALRSAVRVQEEVSPRLTELLSLPEPQELPVPEVEIPPIPQSQRSFWARLFGVKALDAATMNHWREQVQANVQSALTQQREEEHDEQIEQRETFIEQLEQVQNLLTAMITGYTMGQQRLERALQHHGLLTITTVGERFDPEVMEVLDVVTDTDRPDNEVIEEVRRGYRWRDKVFRPAQVRVAKR